MLALMMLLVGVVVLSCTTSYPPCYRGEFRGCRCSNAATGYQACDVTEEGFLACVCDGTTPGVDGGRDAGDSGQASEAAAGPGYLEACGPNDACDGEGLVCFAFGGGKGKICTTTCAEAQVCPAPSPGCSPMNGVCRAP